MASRTLDFDTPISVSLEAQMERLVVESFAISNVIDTFKSIIPNLAVKLNEAYASLKGKEDYEDVLSKIKKQRLEVSVKLKLAPYVNYNKTLVSVPEGFKGDFLDYVKVLDEIAPEVFQEAHNTLGEYNFALSAFITNKESKISLKDHTDLFNRVKKRRESLTLKLGAFFNGENNLSKNQLGKVVSRFADVDKLIESMEALNRHQQKSSLREISDSVKKSVELLSIIVKDAETGGTQNVSGNAALNISQGAYEIGKYVEFISVYRYRIEQMNQCCVNLIQTLDKVL